MHPEAKKLGHQQGNGKSVATVVVATQNRNQEHKKG